MMGGFPEVDHVRRGNTDIGVLCHFFQLADPVEGENGVQLRDEFVFRLDGAHIDLVYIQVHMIKLCGMFQVGFPVQRQRDIASPPLKFRDEQQRQIIAAAEFFREFGVVEEDFSARSG